jgi:cob(I)alamin adenosyltransferase
MVTLSKIYTRGGDLGETSLGDGSRRRKDDLRVEAYGTVDEANATIGLVRLHLGDDPDLDQLMARVQNDLFDLGADLCTPEDSKRGPGALRIEGGQVEALETEIDRYNEPLSTLKSFILPGGTPAASYFHLARTTTRRAERLVVALSQVELINEAAVKYLNRLSDLLFVLGRHANDGGKADVLWVPGQNR